MCIVAIELYGTLHTDAESALSIVKLPDSVKPTDGQTRNECESTCQSAVEAATLRDWHHFGKAFRVHMQQAVPISQRVWTGLMNMAAMHV